MNSSAFYASAYLKTPIIYPRQGFLTLDAVLGAQIMALSGDPSRIASDMPLAQRHGQWCASAGFLESVASPMVATFVRGLSDLDFMRAPVAWPEGRRTISSGPQRGKTLTIPVVDQVRGDYKTCMDKYTAYACDKVTWYGNGDIERVRGLLRGVFGVGKKVRHGWGEIESFEIEPLDVDLSLSLEHAGHTRPMRPIPLSVWVSMGHSSQDQLVMFCAADLPRWSAPEVECVVPPSKVRDWTF